MSGSASTRGPQIRLETDQVQQSDALQTLEENHDVAVGHLHGLVELGQRADSVQIGGGRIFDARIELRDDSQQFLFALKELTSASELSRPTVSGRTAPGNSTVSLTGRIASISGTTYFLSAMVPLTLKHANRPCRKSLDADAVEKVQ